MILTNIEYNYLIQELNKIDEAYKQSTDKEVREFVKNKVLINLDIKFPELLKVKELKMTNLNEIIKFKESILNFVTIKKNKLLKMEDLKKLKIRENEKKQIIIDYNNNLHLTYYSKQIDQKFIIIYEDNNNINSFITELSKNKGINKNLCSFCNTLLDRKSVV